MKWFHAILILGALALAACPTPVVPPPPDDIPEDTTPPVTATIAVTGIVLSISAQTLPPGTQYQLQATVEPADATNKAVIWMSSNEAAATVTEGLVQAVADGSATIIVTTKDGGYTATCAVTVETQVIPPPEGLTGPVKAALYDGTTVRLWDGTNTVDWKTGIAVHANGRKIAVGEVLYFLDADGAITQAINLPALPAGVTVIGDPVTYTFEEITSEEAMEIDWTPGARTRIWQDGAEYGDWHENSWTYVRSFEAANSDVIAVDDVSPGRYHDVTRALDYSHIIWAVPLGPIFYMPDFASSNNIMVYDAEYPDGRAVTITGGGFPWWGREPWIEAAGIYYDGYGDVWNPGAGTFTTHSNSLQQFAGSLPSLITATGYSYHDAGQYPQMIPAYLDAGMIYFIECVSGALVSFSPSTGVAAFVQFLYAGDGWQSTGQVKAKTLKPEFIDADLYFHDAGTLWCRDGVTTITSAFSADQELWVME